MRTVQVNIKPKSPAYGYFDRNITGSRKVRNKANFLIRNTMTGLNKPEEERADNERQALEQVFSGLGKANAARIARGREPFPYPTSEKWMLSYAQLDAILKYTKDPAYYGCASQVNQQAIRKTVQSWKAYFRAKRDYAKHPEKYKAAPRIPGYIKTPGTTAHYTNQVAAEVHRDGRLCLKLVGYGLLDIGPGSMLPGPLVKAEAKPRYGGIRLLLTYKDGVTEPEVPEHPERVMGVDPGVVNLMTCVTNTGSAPFIIDGGPVKAENQWYNKRRAEICSAMESGDKPKARSASLDALSRKRDDRIRDYFYKAAHEVCRRASADSIEVIVFGHTEGQKQDIRIGDANDQNFVQIPYTKLLAALKCAAAKYGIAVVSREESYTSKASLLDLDAIPTHGGDGAHETAFSGRRAKRGLYVSSDGTRINADVNAAGNIMRKAYPYAFDSIGMSWLSVTVERVTRDVLYPQRKTSEHVSGRKCQNRKSPAAFKRHENRKAVKRGYEELFPPIRKKKKAARDRAA